MQVRRAVARSFTVVAAVASAVALSGAGASSAEPAQKFATGGDDIWTLGDNGQCWGAIHVDVDADHARPGRAFLTLTPLGFHGIGPDWAKSPVCNVRVTADMASYVPPIGASQSVLLTVGEQPQAPVRMEIATAPGMNVLSLHTWTLQKPAGYYVILP